jgi:cytochrome P450
MVGPDANKFVLQTHREHFSHDQGWTPIIGEFLGKGLLNMDDPEHAVHRKMMNPAFTIAYMARYLPIMHRVIAERTAEWARRGVVDIYEEARKITFDVAAEALVGFKTGAEVDLLRELFSVFLVDDFDPENETEEQFWQRVMGVQSELTAKLSIMIAARREATGEFQPTDTLAMLVRARDEQGRALSDAQILGHVNILLVAGHETSTSLSTWLLYLLATHPGYLARVRTELDALPGDAETPLTLDAIRGLHVLGNAVTEAGRLYPPAGNVPRGVLREFEFAGYTIPAGARVIYSIAASHRLPAVFADPERFDPDRFAPPREEDKRTPYGLVTFGGGPRICIGINFAQVEIKALAAHVLRAYTLEPLPGQDIAMAYYSPTGTLDHGIRMRVRPRS